MEGSRGSQVMIKRGHSIGSQSHLPQSLLLILTSERSRKILKRITIGIVSPNGKAAEGGLTHPALLIRISVQKK